VMQGGEFALTQLGCAPLHRAFRYYSDRLVSGACEAEGAVFEIPCHLL